MKKFLAALLSFVLVMSASITAFGATEKDVEKTIKTAFDYAYGNAESFDVSESKDFYYYEVAGILIEEFDEDVDATYLNSVKALLDSGEKLDIGTLGLIINNVILTFTDPTDFYGYDLLDMFENSTLSKSDNLYTYMYAMDIATIFGYEELAMQMCDAMVAKYTMGVGTDFWGGYGTSADDLSAFIITLSAYYDEYEAYIEDALTLLKGYNTDAGYDNYGANADSTAIALSAFISVLDFDAAEDAYNKLMLFYNEKTGGFNGTFDDIYSTKEAIFALSNYWLLADPDEDDDEDWNDSENKNEEKPAKPGKPVTDIVDKVNEENKAENVKTEKEPQAQTKSPATGAEAAAFAVLAMITAGGVMLATRKKED